MVMADIQEVREGTQSLLKHSPRMRALTFLPYFLVQSKTYTGSNSKGNRDD